MSKLELPKKQVIVDYEELDDIELQFDEMFNLIIFKDEIKYDFVIHLKSSSSILLVLGSGLTPRNTPKMNPYYNRVSWDFKYSTIFYNDPTSYVHDEIYGAWGVGTKNNWYLEGLADIIKKIADGLYNYYENNSYKNIIFIGSSQAGFMSFMLSVLVKNSSCISDIPQTDIFYGFDKDKSLPFSIYKESMLKYIFCNEDLVDIYDKFGYRLSFIELMKKKRYIPNAFLCFDCSFDIDFETQYLPFFKKLNQLPFRDEFDNTIRIRIDGKNVEHRNMSKEALMATIDNVIYVNNCDAGISFKSHLNYNIVENCVFESEIIRFFGFDNNINLNNLSVISGKINIPFTELYSGFTETLGSYYDLPASRLGVGIHKICIKYNEEYSRISKIFVKSKDNIVSFNVWSCTEYNGNTDGFFSGQGQFVESSDEWCILGEKSLKITKIDNQFTWTDIPITSFFKGDLITASATIKSDCDASIFFVFEDSRGVQSFSNASIINPNSTKTIYLKETIGEDVTKISLRIWIKGQINSSLFVDDLNVINKKINVAIYGSCCTKDPFTSLFNKGYKKDYLAIINDQRHSLISTMQEKENLDESLLDISPPYSGSKFITKCIIEDFNKNFITMMLNNHIDYLVFDIFFEIDCGVIVLDNGKIITNARGFENTIFYKIQKNKRPINMLNNHDEFLELWIKYCDMFFDFLKSHCPNTKIVLSEVRIVDKILKDDGNMYIEEEFTKISKIYNPLIQELEDYIKENYSVSVISFDETVVCLENHIWGKHFVHYQPEYYKNFLKKFASIVKNEADY